MLMLVHLAREIVMTMYKLENGATQSLARLDARIMGVQGFVQMQNTKDNPMGDFNCVELQLNAQDIDELEDAIVK